MHGFSESPGPRSHNLRRFVAYMLLFSMYNFRQNRGFKDMFVMYDAELCVKQ